MRLENIEMKTLKPAKWAAKAGVFEIKMIVNLKNAKLPQFTEHKEFNMNIVYVFDDS